MVDKAGAMLQEIRKRAELAVVLCACCGILYGQTGTQTSAPALFSSSLFSSSSAFLSGATGSASASLEASQAGSTLGNGQSPFFGSVPQKALAGNYPLTLRDAIDRGLKFNLGLLLSGELDPTDYRVAVERAQAELADAEASAP